MRALIKRGGCFSLIFLFLLTVFTGYRLFYLIKHGEAAQPVTIRFIFNSLSSDSKVEVTFITPNNRQILFTSHPEQTYQIRKTYLKAINARLEEKAWPDLKEIEIKTLTSIQTIKSFKSVKNESGYVILDLAAHRIGNASLFFKNVINWSGDLNLLKQAVNLSVLLAAFILSLTVFMLLLAHRTMFLKIKKLLLVIKGEKLLLISLVLAVVFTLWGINWGQAESWNPDQLSIDQFSDDFNLEPDDFLKPPFHSYYNFFLGSFPFKCVRLFFNLPKSVLNPFDLIWARLLSLFLLLGAIILVYLLLKQFVSRFAASILTLVFASTAGLIAYTHFLTTDIPVLFWMLLSFYFSARLMEKRQLSLYLLAGFFCGVAAAVKYNGLGIGIAIPIAHLLSHGLTKVKKWFFDPYFYLSMLMVGLGFIWANPYCLIVFGKFRDDFLFNYLVTPIYGGQTGHSFLKFFYCIKEIIGLPFFIFNLAAILISCVLLFLSRDRKKIQFMLLLGLTFAVYYIQFGRFARLPVRFVLPIVPYFMLAAAVLIDHLRALKKVIYPGLALLLIYNSICCFFVGYRLLSDPRMKAAAWIKNNIQSSETVEVSPYCPDWKKFHQIDFKIIKMPFIDGRNKQFKDQFKGDNELIARRLKAGENEAWFSRLQLQERDPDYIMLNSLFYSRFYGRSKTYYPDLYEYLDQLIREKYGYKIIFDQKNPDFPAWIYPSQLDFLQNRLLILKRE